MFSEHLRELALNARDRVPGISLKRIKDDSEEAMKDRKVVVVAYKDKECPPVLVPNTLLERTDEEIVVFLTDEFQDRKDNIVGT